MALLTREACTETDYSRCGAFRFVEGTSMHTLHALISTCNLQFMFVSARHVQGIARTIPGSACIIFKLRPVMFARSCMEPLQTGAHGQLRS